MECSTAPLFEWRCSFLGLRPGPFLEMFLFTLRVLFSLGLRPGPFLEMFFFTLRALFSLGLRPALSRPPGILPPAGNFLLAQKVPQKRLPPVALRGLWPHLRPSWGFPHLSPSARVAGRCAKLGACQQCRLRPSRKICLARNPPPSHSETASKNTLHSQPSWGFPLPRPSARVAGRCAKYKGCQQCSLHSTSCLRHEAFKQPICQLCIVSCQFTS